MDSNIHKGNISSLGWSEQILRLEDKISYVLCDQQLGLEISICFLLVFTLKMWNYSWKELLLRAITKDLEEPRRNSLVVRLMMLEWIEISDLWVL